MRRPGADHHNPMNLRLHPWMRVLALYAERKAAVAALLVLVVVAAGCDIAVPFLTQQLIDTLIRSFQTSRTNAMPALLQSGLGILAATVLVRATRSLYNYRLFRTVTEIEDRVRQRAFASYLHLDAKFHHAATSGQIIGRIDAGSAGMFTILYDICGQSLVPPLVIFAGVIGSLLAKNAWIALAVCLPVPLYLLVVMRLTRRIYEIEQQGCEDFEALSKEIYDVASNSLTVKKFAQEEGEILLQARLQHKARSTQYRGERLWAVIENFQSLVATCGRVTVIMLGAYFVLSRRATVGEFVLFIAFQDMAYQPVCQLSILFPRLRRAMSRMDRLFRVLDQRPEIEDRPGAPALPPLEHSIEFSNVWFRYSEDGPWVLRNVSVAIPAGTTVALVGRSGSGKTTFVNLLQRLYDPNYGSIRVDGVDIREVTQESLRKQIAVVPQEVDLFSRTVAQNIAYGKTGASEEEIEAAAVTALAHDFILRTEDGYGTKVGERGMKLSGGERQRIGIARAVMRNPRILILDEATSHLDTESERLIQQATERVVEGRTSFLIAHRLSTVLRADLVIVFDHQGIEAVGTHEELRRTSPTYRKLYAAHEQAARSAVPSRTAAELEVSIGT